MFDFFETRTHEARGRTFEIREISAYEMQQHLEAAKTEGGTDGGILLEKIFETAVLFEGKGLTKKDVPLTLYNELAKVAMSINGMSMKEAEDGEEEAGNG